MSGMNHFIEAGAENEDYGMQFIESIRPPFADGKIIVTAEQNVEITKPDGEVVSDTLKEEREFLIASRAFTMDVSDVYSVSPGDNTSGNFSNELPHITFRKKTLPWEYETEEGEPWLAIITAADGECSAKDMTITALKANEEKDVFFPVASQPKTYLESDDTVCHVIDISRELFLNIAPRKGEKKLLAHGKFLNLLQKTDESLEMDGYFSTVMGGRFVPSGNQEPVKSTVHLVSMLGYDRPETIPPDFSKVRLLSLYHWTVFSKREEEPGFVSLMDGLDSDMLRICGKQEFLMNGYVPKRHLFRSGESTVSVYRGPFAPFKVLPLEVKSGNTAARTADGALIFRRDTGLFDASYSAAWQMGRLLTIQNKAVALAIVRWRKQVEMKLRRRNAAGYLEEKVRAPYLPESIAVKAVEWILTKMSTADVPQERGTEENEKVEE